MIDNFIILFMKKYLVKVKSLRWYDTGYIVEADSADEAKELYNIGDIEYDDYDCTDQSEVTDVEEYYED